MEPTFKVSVAPIEGRFQGPQFQMTNEMSFEVGDALARFLNASYFAEDASISAQYGPGTTTKACYEDPAQYDKDVEILADAFLREYERWKIPHRTERIKDGSLEDLIARRNGTYKKRWEGV